MALIHESLYQSTQLDRIDMVSYISTLTRRLFESHAVDESRIAVHLETESVELGIEAAIPCGLILNELVSNALQHAFPTDRSGSLSVKLSQDDTGYRLSVSDDGVGLAADVVIEDSDTLGLTLVHTLCAQLRATYEIQRGPGTAFHLHVPAGS
jgi:two-component sensor histidine kinase